MPRLIVPSIGGGAKRSATVRAGGGEAIGVADSCAWALAASARKEKSLTTLRDALSNIITPIEVGKNIAARLAFQQKADVDFMRDGLLVETVEAEKMFLRSPNGILWGGASFHQERPVA